MVDNLSQKVLQYEEFLNERLRSDLHKVLAQRDQVSSDVMECNQLQTTINLLHKQASCGSRQSMKTMVDLGCNFYAHAKVEDCSTILVSVGLGFYLEMTLEEASGFVAKKIAMLTSQVDNLSDQAAQINGRIKVVMETLRELQFSSAQQQDQGSQRRDPW